MIKALLYIHRCLKPYEIRGEINWDESDQNKLVLEQRGISLTVATTLIRVIIEDDETTKVWQAYYNDSRRLND